MWCLLERCESSVKLEAQVSCRIGAPRRGWAIPTPPTIMPAPLGERLRTIASMALFVVLAGYVGFSAIRLGLLLWQRFALA
jgi:hypothetical protein